MLQRDDAAALRLRHRRWPERDPPGGRLSGRWSAAPAQAAPLVGRVGLEERPHGGIGIRPRLTELYRALRELQPEASATELEEALCGTARFKRDSIQCARLLAILTELGLIELDLDTPSCRVVEAVRGDLELSATYRSARDELAATEHALAPELPRAVPAAATG